MSKPRRNRADPTNNKGENKAAGLKKPNPWGLYDMHGNVLERFHEWYGGYSGGELTDPKGPVSGLYRMHRGGHWNVDTEYCRSALRNKAPVRRYDTVGFRVVCTITK